MLTETIDMLPGGTLINIPAGQWHSLRSLETGTVLLECKDGAWEPLGKEDILTILIEKRMTHPAKYM